MDANYNSSPPTFQSGALVNLQTDVNGNLKIVDASGGGGGVPGYQATPTWSNPSVANATSVTVLAAGTRTYLGVQNNTSGTITVGTGGQVLSNITGTNGIVVYPGQLYEAPSNAIPQGAITVYQTSGSTTTLISVGVC